ncbi:MAG: glycosyltransferase family 4 protein [SAR202 cluster bacterium]|nr:glycosyltransferase family 4 protein [SAR202 cluster bacterium]
MKIAMVSPYDYTWPGGVTVHISQLTRELTSRGHQVQVLAPHSPSRPASSSDPFVPLGRSVPVPSGGSIARVSLSWWLAHKIQALLKRESFDIIHLHEPLAPVLPLCVLEYSNAVNVGTFHACSERQHLYKLSQPIIKRWHERLHGTIAVSPAASRYVNNTFPGDYHIIPNGIDLDHFTNNTTPWPQYRDGKTNILFVGRMEKRKGLRYLLEAYGRLKWDMPNIRLLVVGPGNLDQESQRLVSARNLEDVVFVGPVSHADLPRYYATADIFCSPATGSESFGIVLLEAMAAGKPIVASSIEGYSGIITHGKQGLLCPPKDPVALTEAIAHLVQRPDFARKLGDTGRQMAQRYRWQVVARQVEDYYYQCLDSIRPRSRKNGRPGP